MALYQYETDEATYMGSLARGRREFDYDSIMLYPASDEMWSTRRRSKQPKEEGCAKKGCLDKRMGQTRDLSDEDVLQLRDMYGCLVPPTTDHCPAKYGGKEVDEDGDCECPPNTLCYFNGEKGCPHGYQTERKSERYFAQNCEECLCVAPTCPATARSVEGRGPDRDGDCKCPSGTVCRLENSYCTSSRSNRDKTYFQATCDHCECRAKCSKTSNASEIFADDQGNCLCPKGTICHQGEKPGCGEPAEFWQFSASCRDCECKEAQEEQAPHLTCRDQGEDEEPNRLGDCLCKKGTFCMNKGHRCPYSGGKSRAFFSAECTDCTCAKPRPGKQKEWAQRPIYLMHENCMKAPVPVPCGASQVRVGHHVWDLRSLELLGNRCLRCVEAKQADGNLESCEEAMDGSQLSWRRWRLVDSSSNEDLCCDKRHTHECKKVNRKKGVEGTEKKEAQIERRKKSPCEEKFCGSNAHCKEVKTIAQCFCDDGFEKGESADQKMYDDCVPIVPPDSRCCHDNDKKYMWVPPEHLEDATFCGFKRDKKVCPTIKGTKWKHELRQSRCDEEHFIYRGDGATP